ncbi:helix-turn-helix domain-containing protein [Streptomyces aurantiacus]|uniref:helix-turn-helix domain-containing protein n=1 Tax=Streptomyces aurantiacus TaxID=47760 RepID=UPI0037DA33E1
METPARRAVVQLGRAGARGADAARSARPLSGGEREEISRGIAAGESAQQLAKRLGRSPSTISREIARNGGRDRYRAASADAAAYERGRRPKQAKPAQRPALRALVEAKPAHASSEDRPPTHRAGHHPRHGVHHRPPRALGCARAGGAPMAHAPTAAAPALRADDGGSKTGFHIPDDRRRGPVAETPGPRRPAARRSAVGVSG